MSINLHSLLNYLFKRRSTVFYLQVCLLFQLLMPCLIWLHSDITLNAFDNFYVCLLDETKALLIAKHIKMPSLVALRLVKPAVKQFVSL